MSQIDFQKDEGVLAIKSRREAAIFQANKCRKQNLENYLIMLQTALNSHSQKLFRTMNDRHKEFGLKYGQPYNIIDLIHEEDRELFGCKRYLILNSNYQFLDSSDEIPQYELTPGYNTEYRCDSVYKWQLWPFKINFILSKANFRCLGCHYLKSDRIVYNKKNDSTCRYWMKCRNWNIPFFVVIIWHYLHYDNVLIEIHWDPRGNSYIEKKIDEPCKNKIFQYCLDYQNLEAILKLNRVPPLKIKHVEQIINRNLIPISKQYNIWM
jgi:hypothetical protein